jgi:hypothetical protein
MSEGKVIPLPEQALVMAKQAKARAAIEDMKLQLALLKHLVNTLDPEHDYVFNQDELTLVKVPKGTINEEGNLQPSDSEDKPFRGKVNIEGDSKGLFAKPVRPSADAIESEEEVVEAEFQPEGDQEGN